MIREVETRTIRSRLENDQRSSLIQKTIDKVTHPEASTHMYIKGLIFITQLFPWKDSRILPAPCTIPQTKHSYDRQQNATS